MPALKAKINDFSNSLNGEMFLTLHNSNFLAHCVAAACKLIVDLFGRYIVMKKLRETGGFPSLPLKVCSYSWSTLFFDNEKLACWKLTTVVRGENFYVEQKFGSFQITIQESLKARTH